ncbi:hypothetical protein F750_0322 [Streptomyces sp. PAMC 26508]|nr:hypothetical protein F750_0322 [Streptomyces sp. PAMC 26508]
MRPLGVVFHRRQTTACPHYINPDASNEAVRSGVRWDANPIRSEGDF